jgi:hypothetical protein
LEDLGRLVEASFPSIAKFDDRSLGRMAIATGIDDLASVIRESLAISDERARIIIDWFTCDPANRGQLFGKGFWPCPLLPDPESDRRYVILAPLLVGSPVRRIETWLERGGLSDSSGIQARGKPFEEYVRGEVTAALAHNHLLQDHAVLPHAIKRKKNGEEIDLLVRVGAHLMVGEVKCFVAPSESVEKFNFLRAIDLAVDQVENKLAWVEANREEVAKRLGVDDPEVARKLILHPVVILNQSFGFGLHRRSVDIVDFHYFRLMLSEGRYQGETRFERGVGIEYEAVELYQDQPQFEERLTDMLRNPSPLRRFKGKVGWRRSPYETSDQRPFFIELPTFIGAPV